MEGTKVRKRVLERIAHIHHTVQCRLFILNTEVTLRTLWMSCASTGFTGRT